MPELSVAKIRKFEQKAKQLGLSERILIENASSNLFTAIDSLVLPKQILVIAGRGNNGADVLSCARKLFARGYKVKVATLEENKLNPEAIFQKRLLAKIKVPVITVRPGNLSKLKDLIRKNAVVLEGILGIGIRGQLSPFLINVITLVNQSKKTIISCDIPSGLDPDSGKILSIAVRADCTITFIAAKKGFYLDQGPRHCGKIFVVDIGIAL